MSRSGYSDDYDETFPNAMELYRNSVERALNGKRGQAFLHELAEALDAMPEKRLIANELVVEPCGLYGPPTLDQLIRGEAHMENPGVCAIGSVGVRRGVDMSSIDPHDAHRVAKTFGISEAMAREIEFENDEGGGYRNTNETPEARWQRMRDWVERHLAKPAAAVNN